MEYSGPQKWIALGSDDRMIDTIKKVVAPWRTIENPDSQHLDTPKRAEESREQIRV